MTKTAIPNITHPGLPDYVGPNEGLFGLVHHDVLAEWSRDIRNRIEVILHSKPEAERATRLHCLVYLDPTGQPWEPFYEAFQRAKQEWQHGSLSKPVAEQMKQASETLEAALSAYQPQLEAQIRALVPNLPWDGTQLVFTAATE